MVPRTTVAIDREAGIGLAEVSGGTSLSKVVAGLNALGVAPREMIDILKSSKASVARHSGSSSADMGKIGRGARRDTAMCLLAVAATGSCRRGL